METLFKDIQKLLLPVQMVEDVTLKMFLTVTCTDIAPMTIEHPQVQEVRPDKLDTVPVLLISSPALDTGVSNHRDVNVRHNMSSPQGCVLIDLHIDPGVPSTQGVKLLGLSRSLLALQSIE